MTASVHRHDGAGSLRASLATFAARVTSAFLTAFDGTVARRAEEIAKGFPVQPFN